MDSPWPSDDEDEDEDDFVVTSNFNDDDLNSPNRSLVSLEKVSEKLENLLRKCCDKFVPIWSRSSCFMATKVL